MVLGGKHPVAAADRAEIVPRRDAEHLVGVAPADMHMACRDLLETPFGHAEDMGDARQEGHFHVVDQPVRLGDMEQPVDDILEDRAVLLATDAQRCHLLGIGLVAGNVLARQIVEPGDVLRLVFRKLEDVAESVHLRRRHDAVGLRHLGRERDHRHGESDLTPRFRIPFKKGPHRFDHARESIARRVGDHADEAVPDGREQAIVGIREHGSDLDQTFAAKASRRAS